MRITIFGLSVSSTWGNGHATLWRGLIRALADQGHHVTFFERDVPYYAANRDLLALPAGGRLVFYGNWADVLPTARAAVATSDVGIVTSYCPDALGAETLLCEHAGVVRCFYDLDTPVTLSRLARGEPVDYVGPHGLRDYHLALSYTGGPALRLLQTRLGARKSVPLYGSVDPDAHRPAELRPGYRAHLSYIGTYAEDRQAALEALFVEPARRLPGERFVIAGAQYPHSFPWTANIFFVRHLPPAEHPPFYASSRLTLNVTRQAMAAMGWCPSGRLFEAAACGAPILSDRWQGLEEFLSPGSEILAADNTEAALAALALPDGELVEIAARARARVLDEHSAARRARALVTALESRLVERYHQRGGVRCGASFRRRGMARASNRWRFPRNCYQWEAGSITPAPNGRAPSASTWWIAWCTREPARSVS